MSQLDLSSFEKALAQLHKNLELVKSFPQGGNPAIIIAFKLAAIQAFEFSYELAVKLLRRYLAQIEDSPGLIQELPFQDIIRRGLDLGLLQKEVSKWKEFRTYRGTTSHTYDEDKADLVYNQIDDFYLEADYLLHQLKQRQQNA